MGLLAGFLDISKSLLGIAAGLGLASPCSDQELISVCRFIDRLPFGKLGQMMVSNGVIGAICS